MSSKTPSIALDRPAETLAVLNVEDSEVDFALNIRELKKGDFQKVEARRVQSGEELKAAFRDRRWDLILSDYNLPGFNILEALEIVRSFNSEIPFILVSGAIGVGRHW